MTQQGKNMGKNSMEKNVHSRRVACAFTEKQHLCICIVHSQKGCLLVHSQNGLKKTAKPSACLFIPCQKTLKNKWFLALACALKKEKACAKTQKTALLVHSVGLLVHSTSGTKTQCKTQQRLLVHSAVFSFSTKSP